MRHIAFWAFSLSISGGRREREEWGAIRVETTRGHRDCVPPTGVGLSETGVYL